MNIGEERRTIIVEPMENPIPKREPARPSKPTRAPAPAREPARAPKRPAPERVPQR